MVLMPTPQLVTNPELPTNPRMMKSAISLTVPTIRRMLAMIWVTCLKTQKAAAMRMLIPTTSTRYSIATSAETPQQNVVRHRGSKPFKTKSVFTKKTHEELPYREWIDDTGNYKTVGRLVKISDSHVRLLKDNGRFSTVAKHRLSQADLHYVAKMQEKLGVTDLDNNSK